MGAIATRNPLHGVQASHGHIQLIAIDGQEIQVLQAIQLLGHEVRPFRLPMSSDLLVGLLDDLIAAIDPNPPMLLGLSEALGPGHARANPVDHLINTALLISL